MAGLQTDSKGEMRESAVNLSPGSTQAPDGRASTGGGGGGGVPWTAYTAQGPGLEGKG